MEHTVTAREAGRVAGVHCSPGEQVAAQALLLEVEGE